jgi:DNA mismatch endonuclease (patch repair protein)
MVERSKRKIVGSDPLTPEQRSYNMSRIRGENTGPEVLVRRGLHARGFRYRLHAKALPGRPDISFPARKSIIFVHGCFWHGHNCPASKAPETNKDFWSQKIGRNRERDERVEAQLRDAGWRILKVWECALRGRARKDFGELMDQIAHWLDAGEADAELLGDWQPISGGVRLC